MILEAINSVFLTFIVTEYLLADERSSGLDTNDYQSNNYQNNGGRQLMQIIRRLKILTLTHHGKVAQVMFAAVGCLNLVIHFHVSETAISLWGNSKVEKLFHIPRIMIAIASFLIAVYFDCRRIMKKNTITTTDGSRTKNNQSWSNKAFVHQLIKSFSILLPIYPFLAVVISFGFLFVVSIFEKLNLPLEVLNMPIYYGTLYGPLSYLYWDVKKKMAHRCCVNGDIRVLGGAFLPR